MVCRVLYLVLASAVLVRKLFFTTRTLIFIVIVYYCVTVKVHIINRTVAHTVAQRYGFYVLVSLVRGALMSYGGYAQVGDNE